MIIVRTAAAIVLLASIAACAKGPDSIAPVAMHNAFVAVPCADARAQLVQERQTLAALESKQRSAVAGDAVGVFLIGVPVSSLTGNDVSGQIGASKGKVLALESRMMSCG